MIERITPILQGIDSWAGIEPKGEDALLRFAKKLEEACAILERDGAVWFRLGAVHAEAEERLG